MTCPRYDFHIHTHYLGCANATMHIEDIISTCESLGVTALGITDHLNRPDQLELHRSIKRDIEALRPRLPVYFGVELNYVGEEPAFIFDEQIKADYGFQFAIGGIHEVYTDQYDLRKIIDIQHRYHLKTCENPMVEVLVHPYWFSAGQFQNRNWPLFDAMAQVPRSYARELAQTARQTNTAIEINGGANLVNPSERYVREYVEYLQVMAEEGPTFALGSDAHDIGRLSVIERCWSTVEQLGIPAERIWRPQTPPLVKPSN